MNKSDTEKNKARLLALRERLTGQVNAIEDALREDISAHGEPTTVPTHPADADVEGLDEQIALAQNEEQLLEDVEAALARIEAGTYGKCVECGREISRDRLNALPWAPTCIECARQMEREAEASA
jgi:RNA polymerase-binding protein DksA